MPKQNTSGRGSGSTATKNVPGNQTPNTPEVNESQIARLRVDQLRDRLRRRGITGTGDMRKSELVDALVRALREGRKTTRSRAGSTSRSSGSSSGPGRAAGTGSRAQGGSAARGRAAGKEKPGNQTPNTPDVNESEIARLKVDQLRDRLRRRGITDTSGMRKAELVDALIRALREGKTTRSGSRGRGSGEEQPGRQVPNPPEVRGSEITRLEVDELRYLLRRRGVAASNMRKSKLVEALITALREGRRAGDDRMAVPMPATPQTTGGGGSTPRGERVNPEPLPPTPVHAELEAAPAVAALPAAPAHPDHDQERGGRGAARAPKPRTAPDDIEDAAHLQPVRSSGSTDGEPTGSGPSVTAETADRVLTDLVPAEMDPVDEVVTPEGTVITGTTPTGHEAVATPPLPTHR